MRFPRILTTAFFGATATAYSRNKTVKDGAWEDVADIPLAPRQEHSTVALSSATIAIVGGIIPNGTGLSTTSKAQLYNITSDTWSFLAPLPAELNHLNAAVVGGKIYVLGGLVFSPEGETSSGSWRASGRCWAYDPYFDEWQPLNPLPNGTERGSSIVGVYGRKVYLAGGMRLLDLDPGPGGEQDTVDVVSVFDTVSGKWVKDLPEAASRLPEGRDHGAGAVVGNTFYVLGGRYRGQANVRDTVFALDLDDLEAGWRTLDAKMPTARGGLSSGTVGKLVYTFGGEGNVDDPNGIFNETEVFDTSTETWTSLQPMKLPRHGGSAVAVGKRVYIPGGGIVQGGSPVNFTDVYAT